MSSIREISGASWNAKAARCYVLKVNAVSYLGGNRGSTHPNRYIPGEWSVESPVAVRREGDKIFVKRAKGKELETAIVQKSPQRPVLWQELI